MFLHHSSPERSGPTMNIMSVGYEFQSYRDQFIKGKYCPRKSWEKRERGHGGSGHNTSSSVMYLR